MFTYKLSFENGHNSTNTVKNLDAAQAIAVDFLKSFNGTFKQCEITTPTGALSIVKMDGSYHWNHNGFSFSLIQAQYVNQYRTIAK